MTMSSEQRHCVGCGRSIPWDANVCPYCGHDYRLTGAPPAPQTSSKPIVGGILIIIAGLLALGMGLLYLTVDASDLDRYGVTLPEDMTAQDLQDFMAVCGVILIVFAVIAVLGGIFALQRRFFGLAVAGGVFGLLGIGFVLGALLGLIGLIFVVLSRSEFS